MMKKLQLIALFIGLLINAVNAQDIYQGGTGNGVFVMALSESPHLNTNQIFNGSMAGGSVLSSITETDLGSSPSIFQGGTAQGAEEVQMQELKTGTFANFYQGGVAQGHTLGVVEVDAGSELPIELSYFEVSIKESKVKLEWQTSTEIDNHFFTIERSQNRKNWEIVKEVQGAGNSNSPLNYKAFDPSPLPATSFYRLKQTDFDGAYTYFSIKQIYNDEATEDWVHLYPNPASDQIRIRGNERELQNIVLFDVIGNNMGRQLFLLSDMPTEKVINISQLRKGIYLLKSRTKTTRFIKQ
ncbi:T9SS type A sorting domain-containing protein [Flammeovirga aprica]|uniref:T9SS type A sorting domain-containing protein n=1 Tax=Flammeovirga aprica JL-4 TaxID=694437 RepID=A0A7X9XB07_9BACT|nr:T9SS type A sorting domain-containing protein [Flammeovirga aprica]NME70153.1 T9SS type A sorting domain-containing protein [Flammeovirga aprica JL-4]